MDSRIARRRLLLQAGAAGICLLAPRAGRAAQARPATPPQTEGPFYPRTEQADKDADLTRVAGGTATAKGTIVLLDGTLRTLDGAPIAGAMVEIWQACASGRYNHPRDRNPAPLDPAFQYWARVVTDAEGRYGFRSIKPGAYPNGPGWMRPPHIHFRVIAPGFQSLTTQMYFEGEDLNLSDRILQDLPPAQRKLVVSTFEPVAGRNGEIAGRFDIVLGHTSVDAAATPELD